MWSGATVGCHPVPENIASSLKLLPLWSSDIIYIETIIIIIIITIIVIISIIMHCMKARKCCLSLTYTCKSHTFIETDYNKTKAVGRFLD